jgi:hypothetical protein
MRSIRALTISTLFAITAAPLFAACTLPLTIADVDKGNGVFRLSWQGVTGAAQYNIEASLDAFVHTTSLGVLPASARGVTVTQKLSTPVVGYSVRVTSSNPANANDIQCSGTQTLPSLNLPLAFDRSINRTIIPVVGSTRGANNSQFKTSLRLGPVSSVSNGKIIFHPAGRPGSDDDPSIPYVIEGGQTLEFDDVVAALGQSGIGSLDIAPNNFIDPSLDVLPVEVRLFNQAPEGTYGTFEGAVQAGDAFRPPDWTLLVPSSRFRANIGVRSVTATHATFLLISAKTGVYTQKALDLAVDSVFMDAADHFFGAPVGEGDSITIHFETADTIAVPFHTFTDNSTNDPALFLKQSPARLTYPQIQMITAAQ